ncbi:hypothetical protein EVAR_31027_1 [Eumeta japonica]|uniref:Uncharacterized protein n=1 Tax=Eumeta variegata TaxID=151549 RepID=A0A4C1VEJ5_EUMVA|nr:hypothetical protein EVAR_31027_1 [Eumeta japonica]
MKHYARRLAPCDFSYSQRLRTNYAVNDFHHQKRLSKSMKNVFPKSPGKDGINVFEIGDLMDVLALFTSSVNFVLYCSMSRQFRSTFARLARRMLSASDSPAKNCNKLEPTTQWTLIEFKSAKVKTKTPRHSKKTSRAHAFSDFTSKYQRLRRVHIKRHESLVSGLTQNHRSVLGLRTPSV